MSDGLLTPEEELLAEALEHHEANRWQQADAVYVRLTKDHPTWAPGLFNYARLLHSFAHIPAALKRGAQMYSATLKADGDFHDIKADAYNGMGTIMLRLLEPEKAKECFRRALMLNPEHPHVQVNYGVACRMCGDVEEAGALQDDALALNPNDPEAHIERASVRLTMGDLLGGFEEYEWRWKCSQFLSARLTTDAPKWNGEPLDGKTIMLPYEQGFGDAIMFIRYARLIKEAWPTANVHAWVPPEVVRVAALVAGVDRVFDSAETHDDPIDFHCPMMSLPRVFGTTLETVPAGAYIQVPWAPYASIPSFRVGIVWAGRPEHGGDKWRSTKLADWKDVLSVCGVQFYSFQMWKAKDQLADAPNVIDATRDVLDFLHTAQRLRDMDLLISVDTAIVHLAGAMGKEVWTLLPFSPDWRWMLEREDTPWYRSMRLFRQQTKGDWASVFARVKDELLRRVSQ